MESIEIQVEALRKRFNTSKIFNQTSNKPNFSANELESIVYIIKHEKKDGVYEVNDDIIVELEKGACHIKNNEND